MSKHAVIMKSIFNDITDNIEESCHNLDSLLWHYEYYRIALQPECAQVIDMLIAFADEN